MRAFFRTSFAFVLLCASSAAASAQSAPVKQDQGVLRQTVEQFLRTQAAGLPGQVHIVVGPIDPRLNLPSCPTPEPFLPPGGRIWGKTSVGIRCTVPTPWTIYVSATVHVMADYVVTAKPLAQGQVIGADDIAKAKGDLTTLPNGIITDASQAIGRTVAISLPLGAPLRNDSLRNQQAVQQGQVVRVVSIGPGFRVATEARALSNATEGQITQARTQSGQVVSGVAKAGGVVEVTY